MKPLNRFLIILILSLTAFSCVKDSVVITSHFSIITPIYATKQEVKANIRLAAAEQIESPGKIYTKDGILYMTEENKGIHVIDNKNPSAPKKLGFIPLPGTVDLAIKDNSLYADMYTDLVVLDISKPGSATLKKVVENVFPHRRYTNYFIADTTKVIVGWSKKDTIVNRTESNAFTDFLFSADVSSFSQNSVSIKANAGNSYGTGGSMARFTLASERLYALGINSLHIFDVSDSDNPKQTGNKELDWSIQTIYPFKDKLFIGTMTGMQMLNIADPDNPVFLGRVDHIMSCDPVVANNDFAFVTIWGGSFCRGNLNELQVINIADLSHLQLIKTIPMKSPKGLALDGRLLFICDDGLKVYEVQSGININLLDQEKIEDTYDVIARNKVAMVVSKKGIYQYNYSDPKNLKLLSKIDITAK